MADGPVTEVLWMIRGTWVSMSLRAGCRLDLFDHLVEPRSPAWLAEATSSDLETLTRLLRVLTELGLVRPEGDGTYVDTELGETLTRSHPSDVRSLALMQTSLPNVRSWTHLDEAVREGAGVYERVNGTSSWEHLAAHPDQEAEFNRSMARRAGDQVAAILAGIDLGRTATVVDVGGGRGAMLAGLLQARPQLTGSVADRPGVADEADAAFAEAGLGDRAHGAAADFFDSVPAGADVYFLANVLHDWNDDDCLRILRTVRSAMRDESRLVIVERVLDVPDRAPSDARDLALVDLHMLVMFGARERTLGEYDALLVRAGFRPGSLIGPERAWNLLETRRAPSVEGTAP